MSDPNPKIRACWWVWIPEERSEREEHDLIVQGNVERFGLRESFRMEEKARRASRESPPRANSAMMVFHDWTLFLSIYLVKRVLMILFRGSFIRSR